MTKQQQQELNAFFKKEEYITELSKRGYSGEKLTESELDMLRNARVNIENLMDIHDLDKETYNKLNRVLLNIINTNPIKFEDSENKKECNGDTGDKRDKGVGSENTLSVAIKKELRSSEKDKKAEVSKLKAGKEMHLKEDYMLTFNESFELSSTKGELLAYTDRLNILQIYAKFGRLTGTIMLFIMALSVYAIVPIITSLFGVEGTSGIISAMSTLINLIMTVILLVRVVATSLDLCYLAMPAIREPIATHPELGNLMLHILSPEARISPIIEKELNRRIDRIEENKAIREEYEKKWLENKHSQEDDEDGAYTLKLIKNM